ncbi:hypothetical protein ACQKCU_26185 [Heyndrickxia sporothermodurans]
MNETSGHVKKAEGEKVLKTNTLNRNIGVTRRIIEHKYKGTDNELLQVVTVFEEGINKQAIKKMNSFTKKFNTLVTSRDKYDWKKSG